jgi:hypothetical protein
MQNIWNGKPVHIKLPFYSQEVPQYNLEKYQCQDITIKTQFEYDWINNNKKEKSIEQL